MATQRNVLPPTLSLHPALEQAGLEKCWILCPGCALALSAPPCDVPTFIARYILINSSCIISLLRQSMQGMQGAYLYSTWHNLDAQPNPPHASCPACTPLYTHHWGLWQLVYHSQDGALLDRLCFFQFAFPLFILVNKTFNLFLYTSMLAFSFFPFCNLVFIIINFGEWLNCQGISPAPPLCSLKQFGALFLKVQPTDHLYQNHLRSLLNEASQVPHLTQRLYSRSLVLSLPPLHPDNLCCHPYSGEVEWKEKNYCIFLQALQ